MSEKKPFQKYRVQTFLAVVLAALLVSSGSLSRVHAAAGDLDSTFGAFGKLTTDFFGNSDEARAMGIQPDGKIVVAGVSRDSTAASNPVLARYNSDGSLDVSFGLAGKVTGLFGMREPRAMALQTDGRILLAGVTFSGSTRSNFALARFNTNGTVDSTFGSVGAVATDFFGRDDEARSLVLVPDGRIVVAGFASVSNAARAVDFALARYNNDGSIDNSFGVAGKVTTDFFGWQDRAFAIALHGRNKIVAAGSAHISNDSFHFALASYNDDGSLDNTFGVAGRVTTVFTGDEAEVAALAIQSDGKLVAAGSAFVDRTEEDFALARYRTDGSLDVGFGSAGKVTTDFFRFEDGARSIAIQRNGKIVAGGFAFNPREGFDFPLARYNPDGSLDLSFGSGGKVSTNYVGGADQIYALALQADGKIVAAGYAGGEDGMISSHNIAVARYEGDQVLDTCLQDDSNSNLFQFNSITGEYQYTNCSGFTLGGTGVISRRGSIITLQQNGPDRRALARIDGSVNKGTALVQVFSQGTTFTITDRNTLNNTCSCGAQ